MYFLALSDPYLYIAAHSDVILPYNSSELSVYSYSFAAGTTDGPGMFNFAQGTTTSNPFWDKVRDFLSEPTQEEMDCQAPKPILLNTGEC